MPIAPTAPSPDLIGTAEAAKLAGVSRWTITRMAQDGTLPAVQRLPGRNGALLFSRAAVQALVSQ